MLIKRIAGADHVFGAPPDWDKSSMGECAGLPVKMVKTPDGEYWMVSAWEPTPDELRRIIDGEPVQLWVRGMGHPVVSINVAGDPNAVA